MSKQLIILGSVLLVCVLYSQHSFSNSQSGRCGCKHCNIDCYCGPCHYDGQSSSYTGKYDLQGKLHGSNHGKRIDRYGSYGGYGSSEYGNGNTKRWGKSKSKSNCYARQKCDCLNKLKKRCKCGAQITKVCKTSKRSGRSHSRRGSDGYKGKYCYKTNKRYGDVWGFSRNRNLCEKNGYRFKVSDKDRYKEAGSGNCLDGYCSRGRSGYYGGYDGQSTNGPVHGYQPKVYRRQQYDGSCCGLCRLNRRRVGRRELQNYYGNDPQYQ